MVQQGVRRKLNIRRLIWFRFSGGSEAWNRLVSRGTEMWRGPEFFSVDNGTLRSEKTEVKGTKLGAGCDDEKQKNEKNIQEMDEEQNLVVVRKDAGECF